MAITAEAALASDMAITAEAALASDVGVTTDATLPPDMAITTDLPRTADGSSEASGGEAGASTRDDTGEPGIARLNVNTPYVNLGNIDMTTGGAAAVIVSNNGNMGTGPLSIVATTGLDVTGCSGALDAGESCVLNITAQPTTVGAFNGTVTITANPGTVTRFEISVIATVADSRG
jgi:hypothetical protein